MPYCKMPLLFLSMVLISGCAHFENRIMTTPACDEMMVVSKYSIFGIGTKISDKDRIVICSMAMSK